MVHWIVHDPDAFEETPKRRTCHRVSTQPVTWRKEAQVHQPVVSKRERESQLDNPPLLYCSDGSSRWTMGDRKKTPFNCIFWLLPNVSCKQMFIMFPLSNCSVYNSMRKRKPLLQIKWIVDVSDSLCVWSLCRNTFSIWYIYYFVYSFYGSSRWKHTMLRVLSCRGEVSCFITVTILSS